jgi:hypothetical protein
MIKRVANSSSACNSGFVEPRGATADKGLRHAKVLPANKSKVTGRTAANKLISGDSPLAGAIVISAGD